jgi:hypothetical protein
MAKARFGLLCRTAVEDFVLVEHVGPEGATYSLQILQRLPTGQQYTVPIGEIYNSGNEPELL